MSITPSGRPAWSRTVSHEDYGGHANKRDYQSQTVVNPRTDVGASGFARLAADAVATTRTGAMLVLTFTNNDTSPAAPTILSAYMMVGVSLAGYEGDAAPDSFPSAVRSGTGHAVFTIDSSFLDAYGIEEDFAPTQCLLSFQGSAFVGGTYVISGNTIAVRCFDAAGAAVGNKTVTLAAW